MFVGRKVKGRFAAKVSCDYSFTFETKWKSIVVFWKVSSVDH